uniref:Uncharacterized protein n=1 Tax=Arion vulgaris TaxID=1028688 RepID=A0A0B6ZF21_9EUPU
MSYLNALACKKLDKNTSHHTHMFIIPFMVSYHNCKNVQLLESSIDCSRVKLAALIIERRLY